MFRDLSAVVPLLLPESRTTEVVSLLRADREPVLWWASPVECQSALHRRHREGALSASRLAEAIARLRSLTEDVDFIAPTSRVRDRAGRALAAHAIRAAGALQLAAALVWTDEVPREATFVCLDARLREAARREGFTVAPV